MEELSNKNKKSTVSIFVILVALLTLLYFWERKKNNDRVVIAKQKAAASDSLLNIYQQLDQELFKIISKHDSTFTKPNKTHELISFLDNVLSRYKTENTELFDRNQQEKIANQSLEKSNDTLRQVAKTLGDKIIDVEIKEKTAAAQVSSLANRLAVEKATFDSLSKAFEKQLFIANKSIPDSLNIISPQGVNLFYYGEVENKQPNGFGVGFYEGKGYYIGNWKSNARSGYGKHFYKDGSTYQGNFKDDLRDGYGIYHYPTGQTYRGSWKQNLMNGSGELIESNGRTLIGTWKDGKFIRK